MAISFAVIFAACAVICTAIPSPVNFPVLKDAPKEVLLITVTEGKGGEPLVLECKLAGDSKGVKFSWTKDDKPLNLEATEITQRPGEGTIIFPKPNDNDAGKYQCFATSTAGTASTRVIHAKKAYIHATKSNLQKLKPVEGKPFKLDCAIPDAYPKSEINWLYQEIADPSKSTLVQDSRMTVSPEGTLYVSSAEKKDANKNFKYVCVGKSVTEKPITLAEYVIEDLGINKSPDNEVFEQYTTKDTTLEAGESAFLYCIFGGTPLAHPDWFKDGVHADGKRGDRVFRYKNKLFIANVWLTDAGTYKCVTDNEKSEPKEHTFKVSVFAAPKPDSVPSAVTSVKTGKDVTIPCRVAGVPAPRLSWTYNAKPLVSSDRIVFTESTKGNLTIADLTARGAQPTDKGYYGCKAENEHGDIYSETLLNVA